MKVEVLYFADCPNHQPAVDRVKEVLRAEGFSADVLEIEVSDAEGARRWQFLGSPSIRVNDLDVEPAAQTSKDFGIVCRTYEEGCRYAGLPSHELIRAAVRQSQTAPASTRSRSNKQEPQR